MTKAKYNNASFAADVRKYGKYSNLAFTIDKDKEYDVCELSICSTSISEIEGSEEGILNSYSYIEEKEAAEDIATFKRLHPKTHLDKI